MVGDRWMISREGTSSSHRDGQTETRNCDGRIRGQGHKAEVISGDQTRQAGRGQAGSVTGNQAEEYWKVCVLNLHVPFGKMLLSKATCNKTIRE